MTEFENVLQDCLLSLERGDSNIDECLRRHPNYAVQLAPILLTSMDLERGMLARPSPAFKARVRGRLIEEMRAHPRKSVRFHFVWMRVATSFAAMLLALLVAGTVYAQGVLPGNPFYGWKLVSENIWRVISPDPVATNLAIAERRADELLTIGNHPELRAQVLEEYLEVVNRLELEVNADDEARIRLVLEAQIDELNNSGIVVPALENQTLPGVEQPTVVPTETLPVIPELPQVNPTAIPQVNPTLPVPTIDSGIVPQPTQANSTILPKVISTVQVPSLLP
jgi:hypothetical protein